MPEQPRICEWCSTPFLHTRTGRGRPPTYCSDVCRREAQNALAKGRMQRMRARSAPPWWEKLKRGRPPQGSENKRRE